MPNILVKIFRDGTLKIGHVWPNFAENIAILCISGTKTVLNLKS